MIGLFVGLFILLLGLAILSNAAFSSRAQFGCVVALIGFVISAGFIIKLIVAGWGVAG